MAPTFEAWLKRSARWLSKQERFAAGMAVGVALSFAAARAPLAVEYWRARAEHRALERLADELALSYEDVAVRRTALRGQPVRWFLTHPAGDQWYVDGDVSKPVRWDGPPPDMVHTGQSGSSRGERVAARVAGVDRQGVILRALVVTSSVTTTRQFTVTH